MSKGRKPAQKPAEQARPMAFAEVPTAPEYLDDVARAVYARLAEVLSEVGTIGQTDPNLIECYAINYSMLRRATIELQTQPLNMTAENGRSFINPLVGAIHNSTQKLTHIIGSLGLSPVSVAKLGLPTKVEEDAFDAFILSKTAKRASAKEEA